jgi:D-apionolactonase
MNASALRRSAESDGASDALLRVWGTRQPVAPSRVLSAGELTCEWSEGSIRNLRWRGVELIRGISYLLRDTHWGTAPCDVEGFELDQAQDHFVARFVLTMRLGEGNLRANAVVRGSALGQFTFQVDAVPDAPISTNRCGLVVLHPASAAGAPLEIEHTDGSVEASTFPLLISPGQVAFNIRCLRHVPLVGLSVDCRLEAELPHDPLGKFEMEDQRNWSDASFKTYVASLLDPWPYVLDAQRHFSQQVTVSVTDARAADQGTVHSLAEPVRVTMGEATGQHMPAMGLGAPLGLKQMTAAERAAVLTLKPVWLVAEADASDPASLHEQLTELESLARASEALVQLDVICPSGQRPEVVADRVVVACQLAGLDPEAVRACPAPYLKSFQPSDLWPDGPGLEDHAAAFARAFPQARVGGGMLTYFTELNRKRQSPARLDFVGHTTTPLVHAADDVSVMQTHESLTSITASVHAIWPGLPYRLGPVTVGMHRNPYGAHTADNPLRQRMAMAPDDPRHQAAFGAAWLVGYAAAVQQAGIEVLSFLHSHGVSGPTLRDDMPDWEPGACVPAWRVHHLLVRASGCALHRLSGLPDRLAGLAWASPNGAQHLLLANLGAGPLEAVVDGAWVVSDLSVPSTAQALAAVAPAKDAADASTLATHMPLRFAAYQVLSLTQ